MSTFHAVVWLDHNEAHVAMFDKTHAELQRIRSRSHHKHQGKGHEVSALFTDVAQALVKAVSLPEAAGRTYELGGPGVTGSEDGRYVSAARLHSAYSFFFLRSAAPTPQLIQQAFSEWEAGHGDGWPTWVFSNHDAPRVVTRWGGDEADERYAQLLLALLFALRGSVCLYQGEELGLPQAHVPFDRLVDPEAIANWPLTLGRDGARTPMPWLAAAPQAGFGTAEPWLPVDPRHVAMSVDQQEAARDSTLQITRQLLAIRRQVPALRQGRLRIVADDPCVLVLERHSASERVVCVFNLSPERRQSRLPAGDWQALAGNARLEATSLSLPPYGYAWLKADA